MVYYFVQLILGLANFLFSNWIALVLTFVAIGICTIVFAESKDWKQRMAGIVILIFIVVVAVLMLFD